MFNDFEQFQQHYTSPGVSHLPVIKILELWIATQKSVDVVVQFGHKYAVVHQSAVDDLVLWLLDVRDCFESEGRDVIRSLQQKVLDQPPSLIVPPTESSSTCEQCPAAGTLAL